MANSLQRLTVLGATGSIGLNTLYVVARHPDRFEGRTHGGRHARASLGSAGIGRVNLIDVRVEQRMSNEQFPGWPHYTADETAAVQAVLKSGRVNYWTGSVAREFESDYAGEAGVRYAIALANGTVALELALMAYGIGAGDEVITTPRTFIASASCAVMRGARPVFADVDADSQNITAETIARVLTPRTRAIIAVHLAGWACEMDGIMALAAEKGLVVIEDCAQANGARYRGRPVGV